MDKDVVLAGWVHDVRVLGGISFILLRDMSGIVQVTAPKAKVSLDIVKGISTLHQEDVILVKGKVVQIAKIQEPHAAQNEARAQDARTRPRRDVDGRDHKIDERLTPAEPARLLFSGQFIRTVSEIKS